MQSQSPSTVTFYTSRGNPALIPKQFPHPHFCCCDQMPCKKQQWGLPWLSLKSGKQHGMGDTVAGQCACGSHCIS